VQGNSLIGLIPGFDGVMYFVDSDGSTRIPKGCQPEVKQM